MLPWYERRRSSNEQALSTHSRYRLTGRLGRGGMAEVFEGVAVGDAGFRRRVAIKRMLPGSDLRLASMFLDEARIVSCLHHANLISILDYGVVDGTPFQVLEFVDGIDGGAVLDRAQQTTGHVPVHIALHICTEVAHALQYVHEAVDDAGASLDIVHRDVKPPNILLSWSGDVKLGDFGIARANNRALATVAGTPKGTPHFMAPEQFLAGVIDRRTDVFSLGCALHCFATGHSPLIGDDVIVGFLRGGGKLSLADELDPDIRQIVERAVAYTRSERYPDMGAMTRDLTQALAARTREDSRLQLRTWLAGLRHLDAEREVTTPLPIEVELGFTGDDAGWPRFIERQRLPASQESARAEAGGSAGSPATSATRDLGSRARPPTVGVGARIWIGAGFVATLGLAVGLSTRVAHSPPTKPRASALDAMMRPLEAAPDIAAPSRELSLSPAIVLPARERRAIDARPAVKRSDAPAPSPDPSRWSGVVAFGGAQLFNAEIFVDGRSAGFVPRNVSMSVGTHKITLLKDGRRSAPVQVEVTVANTPRSPLRFSIP